jgi:hypothetical protein
MARGGTRIVPLLNDREVRAYFTCYLEEETDWKADPGNTTVLPLRVIHSGCVANTRSYPWSRLRKILRAKFCATCG